MRNTTQDTHQESGSRHRRGARSVASTSSGYLHHQGKIQARIKHFEEKLANIQNKLTEIEWSESLEWIEDKAGIEA